MAAAAGAAGAGGAGAAGSKVGGAMNSGLGGGHGRDASKIQDMSNWAYQFYTPYENKPQGQSLSELMNQIQGGQGMIQNQQRTPIWQQPGIKNNYIQNLLGISKGIYGR